MLPQLLDRMNLLAAATPEPLPIDEDTVSPGVIALLLLVVMGAAVVFLVRSMNSRLRNIDVDRHRRDQEAKGIVKDTGPGTGGRNASPVPIEDDDPEPGNP